MENDIRKTGAQNYRQLQSQNNKGTALDDRFKIQLPASNADPANFLPRYEKSALQKDDGSDYWGNSMFDDDKYGLTLGAWEGVQDIRADNQPWYAKAAAGIGKAATTALTTFLSGTAGLATGIVQSVINACTGENVVSGLWDNPVTQFLNDVNQKMEEWMPNYYTRAEQNRPWYQNLGTMNFWFDSVVKNMGFTIGAVYSGGLATKAINWIVGLSKAGKLAKMAGVAQQELQAGAKAAQALKATRRVKMFAGSLVAAESEGAIEAINASNDFVRLQNQKISTDIAERTNKAFQDFISNGGQLDEYGNPIDDGSSNYHNLMGTLNNLTVAEQAARKEVDKARTGVGNFTLAGNLPVLMFSNMVTFGKTFAGGWKAARNLGRAKIKGTKEAIKEAKRAAKNGDPTKLNQIKSLVERAEKSGFKGFTDQEKTMVELYKSSLLKDTKLGAAYAVLKSPVVEGNEEMAQGAVSQAAQHFYEGDVDYIYRSRLGEDVKKKDFWDNLGSSLGQGMDDYYANAERWEEGFIGALTGLLGSPTFGRSQNSGNTTYLGKGKKIGMSGGAIAKYREWKDTRDLRKKRLQKANVAIKDHDKLEKELRHLAAQMRIAKDQQNYLLHDDEFNWKNARTAALFEDVMHLKRVGRLDMVKSIMQQMDDFTLEDAQEILEEAQKQTSTSMTEQELQKVQQEKDQYDKEIEQYKTDIANIEQNIQMASERGESQATMQLYYDRLQQYNKALNTAQNESAIRQSILNGDTLTRSQYTHTDGTMFTAQEVLDDLKKRKAHYNKMIDQIATAQEEIDFATGENVLDDDQLDTLTWYRVMAEDWQDRAESIVKENEAVIDAVLSNDKLTTLIDTIEQLEGYTKDNRVAKELKAMIGGALAHTSPQELKNVKNALEFLKVTLHTEGARYNVARMLAKGIIDASGKKIMTAEQVKNLMKAGIEASNAYKSAQEKIKRDIDDLVNIGLAFEKYNELLGEYTKDPNKITAAHEAADKKEAEKENSKRKYEIKKNSKGKSKAQIAIDTLDDDVETIHEALDLEDEGTTGKDDTPDEGNALKGSDTPKESSAGDSVIQIRIALSEILVAAQKDPSLTTAQKEWLRRLVLSSEIMEDVDSVSEIIPAIIKAITEGKLKAIILSDNPGKTEEDLLDLIENAETNIHKFLQELTPKLQDYVDATIDAATQNRDPEEIRRASDTPEESNSTKGKDDTPQEEGDKKADTPNEESEEEEEDDEDWNNGQHGTMPTATNTEQKTNNKAANFRQQPRQGISTEYAQRPWLSQLYLSAVDLQTYADYLEAHPEETPKGVDKAAYLKYVKAITKLIYFNYVRGLNPNERLQQGDSIEFIVDKIINEEAGTTVVLMRSNGQIIGSLPSALDFETVDKNGTKLSEKIPQIYNLYKAVVEETAASVEEGDTAVATITSKVVSLMGGSPAFSATNRTVSDVFGEETPSLAIVSNQGEISLFGMTQEDINTLSTFPNNMMTKGQVYVFVTSNRGTKLPLLTIGKQLSEVFKNKNDWYTKSTIAAIQECADGLDIGTKKAQLAKWIPFFFKGGLNNVSINIVTSKTGKRQLLIKWGKEDKTFKNAVSFAIDKNGKISENKVLSFLKAIANTTVNSNGKALKPTINVNKHMLNDADYVKHITQYLYINIVKGETRTVNDWFTYEMPKLETKPVERNETYVDSEGKTRNKDVPIVNMSVLNGGNTTSASFQLGTTTIKVVADPVQTTIYINGKKVEGVAKNVDIMTNILSSLCRLFYDFESNIKTKPEQEVVIELAKAFSKITDDPFSIISVLYGLLSNTALMKQFHSTNDAVIYLMRKLAQNSQYLESKILTPVVRAFNNMTNNDPLEALFSKKDKSKIIDADSVIAALKDPTKAFDIIMAIYQENPDNNTYKLVGELFTRYTPEIKKMEAVVRRAYEVIEEHKKSSEEAPIASIETEEKPADDEAAKKKAAEALSRISRKGSGRPRPSRPTLSGRRNNKRLSTVSSTQEQAPATKAQRRKELNWLYKMLPQLTEEERLQFVEDLIDVAERGEKAWGMYSDGITTISKLAVYGTVYHEAFHAVFDQYLSEEEKAALLREAKESFHLGEVNDETAEEALAEGFKHFMINPNQQGFGKRILNFFRNLFNQITGWRFAGKSIDAYYRRIAKGGYTNYNTIKDVNSTTRYSTTSTTQKLNQAVQDLQKEHQKIFREEAQRFLDNFGIKIQDMKDYNSDMPLFDALDKVIYTDGGKNLTDTVGYAIAFLMQHTPEVKNMIKILVKGNDSLFIKGQRRHINKTGEIALPNFNAEDWGNIDKDKALKEVGKEIAYELRRLYGIEKPKEKRSKIFLNRLALLVRKLFDILTPQNRIAIQVLRHSTINIANSVKLNDPSIVLTSLKKPGTNTIAQRVDLAKALRENELERNIIETLQKYNIAIGGSATIAVAGTLFRPIENPLHDIDFEAEGYTKEQLYDILKKEFKHVLFKHTIINPSIGSQCETFLIMDRDFKYGRTETIIERKGGKNQEKLKQWLVDKDGNEIGYFINSDLVLNEGVKGKFLDFFIQPQVHKPSEVKLNGRNYLVADWRNSMSPKLNWARTKDIWDYIRFLTNKQYDELQQQKRKEDEQARMKFQNSKVIWGHPTIGKTKYLETHDDILEWDKEINTKKNEFIAQQIDPNNELSRTSEEYIYKRREYMTNWEQHPEYIEFLTTEWKNLLERGKKEGKTIFASPLPLLRLFPSTFNLILAINSRDFIQRNTQRGGELTETRQWKQAINDVLVKVDPEKIIFTNEYFADFMSRMLNSDTNALTDEQYAGLIEALDYKNLTQETKDYLEARKITEEEYQSLDTLWKQQLLKCM